jgi:hypothetical protein
MTKSLAILMLILQLATVGLLTRQYLQDRQRSEDGEYEEDDGPTTIDDLADDISQTRFELKQQVDRMTRMIDGLARDGIGAGNPAAPQDDSIAVVGDPNKLTTAQLVTKVIQLHEMHARYEFDPLQREPIEKERARIEDVLRNRGVETIDSIGAGLHTTMDTRAQSRLLEYVVGPIIERGEAATPAAEQLALDIFNDTALVSGVRLIGARLALKSHRDTVIEKLVEILGDTANEFPHREDIARFFEIDTDPRAVPVLAQLAKDVDADQTLRFFCLGSLGAYQDSIGIDALKEVARGEVHGSLRGKAIHSLNRALGKDVLPFLEQLKATMAPQDPLQQLVKNLQDHYANGGAPPAK